MVTDQTAALRALLMEALQEQAFTDDVGFDVSWTPGAGTGPPFYHLLFTLPSPVLGDPPVHAATSLPVAAPHQMGPGGARELAATVLETLRSKRASVLAAHN